LKLDLPPLLVRDRLRLGPGPNVPFTSVHPAGTSGGDHASARIDQRRDGGVTLVDGLARYPRRGFIGAHGCPRASGKTATSRGRRADPIASQNQEYCMALQFVGFGNREDVAKETLKLALSSIANAYGDLVNAVKHAASQVSLNAYASRNPDFRKRYATWFGTLTPGNVVVVKDNLSAMNTVISKGDVTVGYNANPVPMAHAAFGHVPCVPGTNAFAYWWAPAAGGGGGLGLKRATYQEATHQPFYMAMCASFFNGANLAGSVGPVRNQSKNGTLIHEISHLAAGTDDHNVNLNGVVVVANGKEATLELAKTNPGVAIDNAENYGYFCDEYHP
jgi:hypothetical protein